MHAADAANGAGRAGVAAGATVVDAGPHRRRTDIQLTDERRRYLDDTCAAAREAVGEMRSFSQAQVDAIVWEMTRAGLLNASHLARLAVEETHIGVFEDKVVKNYVATEFLYDYLRAKRTVGVIEEDPARNMKLVAEPIGVVLGIMPITNPTSTALFKTIVAAKTRNAMIVRPSSRAYRCAAESVRLVVEAGMRAGLPEGAIQCLDVPTKADTQYLFGHEDVDFIWTTGGQEIVTAANASGKPTIGVGPGNAPAYLHASCNLGMAVNDILLSKTFDASVICPAEQTLVIDDAIWDEALRRFANAGARILTDEEADRLLTVCFDRTTGHPNMLAIGRSVKELAGHAGIEVESWHKVFVAPVERFDRSNLLLHEKLFPVLAALRAPSVDEAIRMADGVASIAGLGHTSAVYSRDEGVIDRFSVEVRTGRILVNCPTAVGALGGMYTDLAPTYSLGCGTWGGSNTTDNVNVDNLLNIKRVAYRKNPPMWFRAPVDIYYNEHAIDNLRHLNARRAIIITSPGNVRRGTVGLLEERLSGVETCDSFTLSATEPNERDIIEGVQFLNEFKPGLIVAAGGGSVLDASKVMRLLYENPDVDWRDLALPFFDVRKRVAEYPERRGSLKLVAIPTTSGTGSEVSPVAVITDSATGRKVTLVDYSLVPEIAIVDPQLTTTMPKLLTADTGVDAMTHAVESLVSIFASPYTQALSLQAFYELYKFLPKAYRDPFDMEARSKVHNAATIAGLAFSNAFVGVGHALAHALGATFGVPHGRACGIFLPHVIDFNSGLPKKTMPAPGVGGYVAPQEYARAAIALGLGGSRSAPEEARAAFRRVVCDTLDAVEIPVSIADLGISEQTYRERLPEMVLLAFEDMSGRANPRAAMVDELEELFEAAWVGR
jgi:acetaldehyde dehydrogenase/alcohol dehydrogenase